MGFLLAKCMYMRKENYWNRKCKADEEKNELNMIFASDINHFCISTFYHQDIIAIQIVGLGVEIGQYVYL